MRHAWLLRLRVNANTHENAPPLNGPDFPRRPLSAGAKNSRPEHVAPLPRLRFHELINHAERHTLSSHCGRAVTQRRVDDKSSTRRTSTDTAEPLP
ncbi:hypothetical protein EVAR_8422_1 [Eumeta japonica]|uniref:Uncharacterized protein n=1 Tax=Eumeta variegata TaxID=151549 RepID=A0A4C1WF60_EUMVA|nr:hypothetical protein EVAR_8422_1 [Eumeta japonica]